MYPHDSGPYSPELARNRNRMRSTVSCLSMISLTHVPPGMVLSHTVTNAMPPSLRCWSKAFRSIIGVCELVSRAARFIPAAAFMSFFLSNNRRARAASSRAPGLLRLGVLTGLRILLPPPTGLLRNEDVPLSPPTRKPPPLPPGLPRRDSMLPPPARLGCAETTPFSPPPFLAAASFFRRASRSALLFLRFARSRTTPWSRSKGGG
jgi:hypothetical protein